MTTIQLALLMVAILLAMAGGLVYVVYQQRQAHAEARYRAAYDEWLRVEARVDPADVAELLERGKRWLEKGFSDQTLLPAFHCYRDAVCRGSVQAYLNLHEVFSRVALDELRQEPWSREPVARYFLGLRLYQLGRMAEAWQIFNSIDFSAFGALNEHYANLLGWWKFALAGEQQMLTRKVS